MIYQLILLGAVVFILGSYVIYKYLKSRNRHLFFRQGVYKSIIWCSAIIAVSYGIIYFLLPARPVDLSIFRLHSNEYSSFDHFLSSGEYLNYYLYLAISVFSELNILGALSALIPFAVWGYYIRSLDFYHTEKISYTILVVLLGAFFTFFTFPLTDLIHGFFGIHDSDSLVYSLFVSAFLGIGVIEEFIKIIPVLIILYFTDEIDEPFDFIYYACFSALGFAFIENLLYFREISSSIVLGRLLLAVVGHMINSTIVVYGLILLYFHPHKKSKWNILLYFILGAFVHALYDFFLFENFIVLFFISFVFFIQVWAILINNAINNSKYFDYKIIFRHNEIKFNLALLLTAILLIDFLLNGLVYGRDAAATNFIYSLIWFGLLIGFYISNLSSLDLFKGYWRSVILFQNPFNRDGGNPFTRILSANTITPLNYVGKHICIHCPASNKKLSEALSDSNGEIISRINMVNNNGRIANDWFVVKLDAPMLIGAEYEKNFLLLRLKDKFKSLVHDHHIPCEVKLVPKGEEFTDKADSGQFKNYGSVLIEELEEGMLVN